MRMRLTTAMILLVLAWPALAGSNASSPATVEVHADGGISSLPVSGGAKHSRLSFELPPGAFTNFTKEGEVIRRFWVNKGIQYTQTAFITAVKVHTDAKQEETAVLMAQISGLNTNSQYAEAWCALGFKVGNQWERLELKDDVLWLSVGGSNIPLAVLEVPSSGVKNHEGTLLRFSGNMPPSEKGALTLKIPLHEDVKTETVEALKDVEFSQELRRAAREQPARESPRKPRLICVGDTVAN